MCFLLFNFLITPKPKARENYFPLLPFCAFAFSSLLHTEHKPTLIHLKSINHPQHIFLLFRFHLLLGWVFTNHFFPFSAEPITLDFVSRGERQAVGVSLWVFLFFCYFFRLRLSHQKNARRADREEKSWESRNHVSEKASSRLRGVPSSEKGGKTSPESGGF